MFYDKTKCILEFKEENEFLSNFHICRIYLKDLKFSYLENAFQCFKEEDITNRPKYCFVKPWKAKWMGKSAKLRSDWESIKIDLMEELVTQKFILKENNLSKKLIATYPKSLVEGNLWNDTFWGVDLKTYIGENNLGKILVKVRSKLISKSYLTLTKNDFKLTEFDPRDYLDNIFVF